ncbi:ubiquitin fusion degradation protein-like protein [Viridothelium virens]|uniref:Ubiquitin fusion degradation protein-like protein n=1 Tax=Viridothelium virens TaxID=1048519 RepID=A0A6A6HBH5_VIRVR|nr:ubiquitin fusion degradation protein-like protein [Viridothelium virens]
MSSSPESLVWSQQYSVSKSDPKRLVGDKIILPPNALEQLLAAAPTVTSEASNGQPYSSSFDPYNPHTYAAEREARAYNIERNKELPHPLTFRLVNPENGRVVYAGIREFSGEEGEITLSSFLEEALGIQHGEGGHEDKLAHEDQAMTNGHDGPERAGSLRITVHAKQLQKGTYVKLRPLEAGYDPEDWKSLLEQHLRSNYTTLTNGEVLHVPGDPDRHGKQEVFRFLVDGFTPEADGVCIVDTDLEVDIEALNEEQARETLRRIAAKQRKAPGTAEGSSAGGALDLFNSQEGQVRDGEYVDYQLGSWSRTQPLEIRLTPANDDDDLELFVNPVGSRLQGQPRDDEHVFADFEGRPMKRIRLEPTNVALEDAEALWVSVHAQESREENGKATPSAPRQYKIRASAVDRITSSKEQSDTTLKDAPPNPGEVRCKNCQQWIPQQSLFLHENFCLRNNILCPQGCGQVFQKRSPTYQSHWHCPHDSSHGTTPSSLHRHNHLFHTPHTCPHCTTLTFLTLPQLAHHRTTTCPAKLILCRFCHLRVPQEGESDPSAPPSEALLMGLTPHEFADGARTTECHLCGRISRLRDMDMHLRHHELERRNRAKPRICRNANCGRTIAGAGAGSDENELGLCATCFGPLYVAMYDPEGKALRRRVERRYLGQLMSGCGKGWCANGYCKTGKQNRGEEGRALSMKEALPLVKPFLDGLKESDSPLQFCVDETSQRRRNLAEMLAAGGTTGAETGVYALEWCVAASEAENGDLDNAMRWLRDQAPKIGEGKE